MQKNTQIIIKKEEDGYRLDKFIKNKFKIPQSLVERLLRKNQIKLNSKRTKKETLLKENDSINIFYDFLENDKKFVKKDKYDEKSVNELRKSIIYQDEDIIVINKPAGLAVQSGTNIAISIDDMLSELVSDLSIKPKLVHRLDKDTSGILLIAKNIESAKILSKAFANHTISKTYHALVNGELRKDSGIIKNNLIKEKFGKQEKIQVSSQGLEAITSYRILKKFGLINLLELKPKTGRMHQLRVHCEFLGVPIIGDGKYGGKSAFVKSLSNRLHLHAFSIEIDNFKGKKLSFKADLPIHFKESLEYLDANINLL